MYHSRINSREQIVCLCVTLTFRQVIAGIIKNLCGKIIRTQPEQMSGQDRDQIVIQDENPQFIEKPQSTIVDSFDHIVVSLEKQRNEKKGWRYQNWEMDWTWRFDALHLKKRLNDVEKTVLPHFHPGHFTPIDCFWRSSSFCSWGKNGQ